MPFLVPGRQSLLQLEKGTCKKRARGGLMVAVAHMQPFYSRTLGFLQGRYCLISMLHVEPQRLTSSLRRADTFCTTVLPQPTAVILVWKNTSRDGREDQQSFVISTVLWALTTGMWPMIHIPEKSCQMVKRKDNQSLLAGIWVSLADDGLWLLIPNPMYFILTAYDLWELKQFLEIHFLLFFWRPSPTQKQKR